jgi:RimJ/RimL family protein N-acetyltransferase
MANRGSPRHVIHDTVTTQVLQTERLSIRHFDGADAAFIVELLNEPSWLKHIGDKGIHTELDARRYLENGPVAMYARLGFGLYMVELKERGEPLGMCGLIKRDTLPDVDLGFAFLSRFCGNGYAYESACAVIAYAKTQLGIDRIAAITTPGNRASSHLLRKLGFTLERTDLPMGGEEVMLYRLEAQALADSDSSRIHGL